MKGPKRILAFYFFMHYKFRMHIPQIDLGVPLPTPGRNVIDLRERAVAACNTARTLEALGFQFDYPTDEDMSAAANLVEQYAEDPTKASKGANTLPTPSSLIMVGNILDEFGRTVVKSAIHIRNLVTNKLLLETENDDARIRLRALELLGKLSDVGLFTEKSEVTITHRTTDELRDSLRSKLQAMTIDGEATEVKDITPELVLEKPLHIENALRDLE